MDRPMAIRLILSALLIIAYLVVAALEFHVNVVAPLIVLGLVGVLFFPTGARKSTHTDTTQVN